MPNLVPENSPSKEDVELAMAINALIQSAIAEGVPNVQPNASKCTNGWGIPPSNFHNGWRPPAAPAPSKLSSRSQAQVDTPSSSTYNGWDMPGTSSGQSSSIPNVNKTQTNPPVVIPQEALPALPTPTAPPFAEETFYIGPVQYPSVDAAPVDVAMPATSLPPKVTQRQHLLDQEKMRLMRAAVATLPPAPVLSVWMPLWKVPAFRAATWLVACPA